MKKILVCVLVLSFTAGMVFAGGKQEAKVEEIKVNPAGVFPVVDEKLTIHVLAGGLHPGIIDMEKNYVTGYMEEKTNIHITWDVIPGEPEEAMTKFNLIMASGTELPDALFGGEESRITQATQMDWAAQGLILPIDDLIEKWGVELKKLFELYPEARETVRTQDGNTYGFGDFGQCFHCEYAQKMWINKTWLDTLGLDMPTTTKEFYQVLKAFKEQDPNRNGIADEVPLAGCIDGWNGNIDGFLMNAFIYNHGFDSPRMVVKDDGTLMPAFIQDEWREGLRYVRKLCAEGLLDPESFIQNPDQLRQLVEGDIVMLGASPSGVPGDFSSQMGEATKNYVILPPLKGPKGVQLTGYFPGPGVGQGAGFLFTKECKSPDALMRWIDFGLSREANFTRLRGQLGVDWRYGEPGEVGINGKPAAWKDKMGVDIEEPQNVTWHGFPIAEWGEEEGLGLVSDPTDLFEIEGRLFRESKKYVGYEPKNYIIYDTLKFSLDEVVEYEELGMNIIEYVEVSFARFVTGDLDVERGWDAYLTEFKNLELDRYVSIIQAAYDRR